MSLTSVEQVDNESSWEEASDVNCQIGKLGQLRYLEQMASLELDQGAEEVEASITRLNETREKLVRQKIAQGEELLLRNWEAVDPGLGRQLTQLEEEVRSLEAEVKSTESYLANLGKEVEALKQSSNGCLHIGLEYRPVKEEVVIQVFSARNLTGKSGDPFVEVMIHEDHIVHC